MNPIQQEPCRAKELARHLRACQVDIMRSWSELVLRDPAVPTANQLTEPVLLDHLPNFLNTIIEMLEATSQNGDPEVCIQEAGHCHAARLHAQLRLLSGYSLPEVLRELSHLRRALNEYCLKSFGSSMGLKAVYAALDEAMIEVSRVSERGLRESQQQLELIQKAVKVALWDQNLMTGEIKWAGRAEAIYGPSPPSDYNAFIKMIYPEDLENFERTINQAIAMKTSYDIEYRMIGPNGNLHWFLGRGQAQYSAGGVALSLRGVNMEISERKRAELERDRFFELSADMLSIKGFDGYFRRVNPAWEKTLGYSSDELMKQPWFVLIHPDDLQTSICEWDKLKQGQDLVLENRLKHKDGSYRWLLWSSRSDLRENLSYCVARDITERKKVETQFQTLANSIPQLAWMANPQGSIYWYNQRWYDYTGTKHAEMKNEGWKKLLHPEHLERVLERLQHAWSLGDAWEDTFPLQNRYGAWRWFLSRAVPIRDDEGKIACWLGTHTDVTATWEIEQQLKISNERLKILFTVTAELLSSWQPKESLEPIFSELSRHLDLEVFFNFLLEGDGREMKLASSGGIGQEFTERIRHLKMGEAVCGWVAENRKAFMLDGALNRDNPRIDLLAKAGIKAYTCFPLLVGQKLIGTLSFGTRKREKFDPEELVLLQTISDQVAIAYDRAQTEQERLQAIRELEKARKEADEANRAKSNFLANMSHEIRTPLGAMLGFAEFLREDSLSREEHAQFVEAIIRNGHELSRLIDDVLDLSKVEAGRVAIEWLSVSLAELLADVKTAFMPKAQTKGIDLSFSLQANVPEKVITDPTRLRQILLNIVGNAIKFTQTGRVSVLVKRCNTSKLSFEVQDTGVGIDESAQTKVFQPFVQADTSTTRRFGGTGLGLCLSRKLAKALGGDIVLANSRLGQGSTFVITLDMGPF